MVTAVELATDNFNRADSADVGTSWAPVVNSLKIAGNQVRPASLSVSCWERYSAIAWGPDQYSQVVIRASASGEGAGPVVRMNTAAPETGYFAEAQGAVGGKLWRVVAGSYTQIGTLPVINTGDTLRLEVTGSALTVKVNGIAVLTLPDAQIASGDVGIKAINTTDGNSQLDDWAGGKLVYPPLYPLYPDRFISMKQFMSDNFNRADSADLGADWTPVSNNLQIVGNAVRPGVLGGTTYCWERYSSIAWGPDQFSEIVVTSSSGADGALGPVVRMSTGTPRTGYSLELPGTGTNARVYRTVSGTRVNIGNLLGSVNAGDTLRIEVEGNDLRAYLNGVLGFRLTDTNITSGDVGIGALNATDGSQICDNWVGGRIVRPPYYAQSPKPKLQDPQQIVGLYY